MTSFLKIAAEFVVESHYKNTPDRVFVPCYTYGPVWAYGGCGYDECPTWGPGHGLMEVPLDELQKLFKFMTRTHLNIPALPPESLAMETRLLKAGVRIIDPKDVIL
jgi:hypothetical protein